MPKTQNANSISREKYALSARLKSFYRLKMSRSISKAYPTQLIYFWFCF